MLNALQKRFLVLMFLTAALLVLTAPARVFWRRATTGSAVLETTPGWHKLFDGVVRINNERGRLAIYGCQAEIAEVTGKLQAAYSPANIVEPFRGNNELALGRIREGENILTFLAYAEVTSKRTLLFALSHRQSTPSGAQQVQDTIIPLYPGGRIKILLEYEATKARFELCSAPADQHAVRAYYEQMLRQSNWQRIDPFADTASAKTALAIYQKDDALLCLSVAPDDAPEGSAIMMLRKHIGME